MVALQQLTRADGIDAVLEVLDADGGVIVRDMVPPDTLARFRADMEAAAAGHRVGSVADHEMGQRAGGRRPTRCCC